MTARFNWQDRAACKGVPVNIHDRYFFPGTSGRPAPEGAYDYARETWCNRCPVKQECLDFALDNNEKWGIWGGLSPEERRVLGGDTIRHGTLSGYTMHYTHGGIPCDLCKQARRDFDRGRQAS